MSAYISVPRLGEVISAILLTLAILLFCLVRIGSASGPVDPSGQPELAGAIEHYAVWHDADGWHVRATAKEREYHFRGDISVKGGELMNVKGFPLSPVPQREPFVVGSENRAIKFDFRTKDRTVGVDFRVGGKDPMLEFSLALGENEPVFDASRIFIGKAGVHPREDPFALPAHGQQGNPAPPTAAERAKMAWDALQKSFAVPNQPGAYYENLSRSNQAFVWSHSQAMHAALNLAMITHDTREFESALKVLADYKLVNNYTAYAPTSHPPKTANRFWDDNGWLGLTLLQASYQLENPGQYLKLVEELWPFLEHGQAKPGGGQKWNEKDQTPRLGIPATGSDDQVALRLHLATGAQDRRSPYRAFAELNEGFIHAHLKAPDGTYYNSWFINAKYNP